MNRLYRLSASATYITGTDGVQSSCTVIVDLSFFRMGTKIELPVTYYPETLAVLSRQARKDETKMTGVGQTQRVSRGK